MSQESFSCACTVKDGKLKIFNREAMEKALYQFPDGIELELVIQEQGRKRTNAQNRFLHGPVCKAFRELGWSDQDTKTELCLRFLPMEHARPDGSVVTVPGHTSALNVEDFNRFLDQVIQFASENDVYIEDAEQWRAKQGAA